LFINSSKYISTQQPALPAGPSKNNNNNNNHASGYYGPSSSQPSAAVSSYYYENPLQHSPEDKNHAEKVQPSESREDTIYYGNSTTSTYNVNPMSGHGASIADKRAERKAAKLAAKLAAAKSKLEVAKANKKRTIDNAVGFEQSSDTMAKRANRFSGAGGISDAAVQVPLNADLAKYMGKTVIGGSNRGELDEEDYVRMTVKGTCVRLEKEYLRLTAPPKSELVRPQGILEHHLQNLLLEWSGPKHRDYVWFCSQLKAIRQDMTVQRIFNGFAVEVYEAHARIALEQGDLNEYNQCQTQLKDLYTKQGNDNEALKNRNEFIAYRLIYYVHQTGNKKYEGGSSDLFKIMLSLTLEQREDSCISHALKVRAAIADFDYHSFWRLLASCPKKHGVYLMKFMIPNVRYWALQRVCKAYRPSVSLNFVLQELGFDAADEGKTWLESCGVVIAQDEVVTKDSVVQESNLKAQNSLI
jgi:SAC3 family protein LENG8/THP3